MTKFLFVFVTSHATNNSIIINNNNNNHNLKCVVVIIQNDIATKKEASHCDKEQNKVSKG